MAAAWAVLTVEQGQVFKEVVRLLGNPKRGLKYKLSVFELDAADFGVPQFRKRVLIIGNRDGIEIPSIPCVCGPRDSIIDLIPWRTVTDGLRGIPKVGTKLANHKGRDHSQRMIDRFQNMKFGERDPKNRTNKLKPDRPSFAIIVGSDKGGGKLHIHPHEAREVTPRESARMQTFPDWYEFSGTSRHPIRQIGNAVPPLMAAMIGREIGFHFFGKRRTPIKQILSKLSLEHLFSSRELTFLNSNSDSKAESKILMREVPQIDLG